MERYKAIFQASPDGILLVDRSGVIREVNDRVREIFGWEPDELVGQPVEKLVPSGHRARHQGHREAYAADPEPRPMGIGRELAGLRKDGTELPVEISLAGFQEDTEDGLVMATVRDVTDRIRLRDFGKAAMRATEEERQRIARELHDDTSQHLAALLIRLRLAQRDANPATRATIEGIRADLMETSEGIRRIARGLRPPELEDAGLSAALRAHARSVREASGLDIRVEIGSGERRLASSAQLVLYRIVQEAISNAVRHADPTTVSVRLHAEGRHVVAEVRDDGRGFDVEAERRSGGGLGLMGMLERAASEDGHVVLESTPGEGTRVALYLPMQPLEGERS